MGNTDKWAQWLAIEAALETVQALNLVRSPGSGRKLRLPPSDASCIPPEVRSYWSYTLASEASPTDFTFQHVGRFKIGLVIGETVVIAPSGPSTFIAACNLVRTAIYAANNGSK